MTEVKIQEEEEDMAFEEIESLLAEGSKPTNSILMEEKPMPKEQDDQFRSYLSWQTEASTPQAVIND